MKALLLSAGLGTRLRPYTDNTPKCLMSIGGRPLLQIWLERLAKAEVGPFLVNTHYLAPQVNDFVASGSFASKVELVHEKTLLGTAGTLVANLDFFTGEDGLLIHADNYCEAGFTEFIRAHRARPKHCLMTMMTFRTDTPSTCGIVELDERSVVQAFHEKSPNPPCDRANGAIYILSDELLRRFAGEYSCLTDFSTQVIPLLMGKIYAWHCQEVFIDIGSVSAYESIKLRDVRP
jgi:mannose-1-phosphate guanylyltransferase